MTLSHDEIEGLLPEYAETRLTDDQKQCVEAHLGQCAECVEMLVLLKDLRDCETPDPGDLFWKTLPQKIRALSRDDHARRSAKRFSFLRLLPLAAALMLIIMVFFVFSLQVRQAPQRDPLFRDPLEYSLLELGDITERQIPKHKGWLTAEEVALLDGVTPSYHSEFVTLSSDELSALYRTLRTKDQTGG
ncbi:MAG: zf-HC2 domain-containing protein [Nitrospirae bacterium]|nr:zf-HC2 domain-containing protein [Nitrospirota bacterium]